METVNDRAIPEDGDGAIALAECSARGELIVPTSEGQSDFEELRRCNLLQRPRMIPESAGSRRAVLVVFDLLRIGDQDLRALPLFERRKRLHQHIGPVAAIKIIEHIESHVNRYSARLSTAIMKASLRSEWIRRIGATAQRVAEDQEPRLLKTRSGRVEGQGEGNGVSGSKLLRMF